MTRGYRDDPLEMLRRMQLIRRFEETALELRMQDRIHGVIHPYIGQEGVAVGVCSALSAQDRIISTHRGHGHCIAKGARVDRMMAELFGRVDGYCRGKGGSMHIAAFDVGMLGANGIVGGGLPIALGSALATNMGDEDVVTVAFFGDGATGEGSFHESLNLAALWDLPLVWVCENNQYASETPVDQSVPQGSVAEFAHGYGIPGTTVDGNDVIAVHDAAAEAIDRALAGDGPTLIEAKTFRLRMHATRKNPPEESRDPSLIAEWEKRDPIDQFRNKIEQNESSSGDDIENVITDVQQLIAEAIEFAERSPYPAPESAFEDLWA